LQFVSGCYYHLYNRGANRTSIFLDDRDYLSFLARLRQYAVRHETAIIAYCLMPNHYHLLVRQETDDKSSLALQYTCNGYSQFFNRRHERSGTLFQGRFRRTLVGDDEYLRHLCRYIHTNPVKDGFALQPELWPYSNYPECVGLRESTAVDHQFISSLFGSPAAYRDFVAAWPVRKPLPRPLHDYLDSLARKE
jgi:REP element-mobilizing transposase RayT